MTDTTSLSAALAGRYVVERELGAGGMAMVYLAHDVRHDRKVALKVLRPELSAILGGDRFLQEIKTTANLQHPHILPLHDSGEAGGVVFYVMPYIEGESLRDRLVREHQLPVDDALRIAREIADALDYAHQQGVVHRDIKPENILLHGGHAMVADFGIALAASRSEGGTRMTETGMSLGTPHYMAPEQAMGEREITPKADIYALGCVVYEMLTGEPPFTGPTAQAIVARVMTEQPRSLTLQRRTVPPHIETAVHRSLEKLPADRYPTARAFADALGEAGAAAAVTSRAGTAAQVASAPGPLARLASRRIRLAAAVAAGLVALAAGLAAGARLLAPHAPPRLLRLSITLPTEAPPVAIRLSPDGRTLAFISSERDRLAIFTRRLDDPQPRRIEGTEDAFSISFSPDGQWLAFLVGTQARKVPVTGGASVAIPVQGNAPLSYLEWAGMDRYVVATNGALAMLDTDGSLHTFATPTPTDNALVPDQVLSNGWVLARTWRVPPLGQVMMIDPESGRRVTLVDENVAWSGYADGLLVWTLTDGSLYGARFDPGKRKLTSRAEPLGGTVLAILGFLPPVTVSAAGLAYAPTRPRALVRVARSGLSTVLLATDRTYHDPRVSPDGRRISLDFTDQVRDVWLFDIADSTLTRFGFDSTAHDAEWLPDGSGLVFAAMRGGNIGVFERRFDRAGAADSIYVGGAVTSDTGSAGANQLSAHTFTRDGRTAIAVRVDNANFDLLKLSMDGSRLDTLLATPYGEGWPALSPDNRWLAYVSDESGRNEVYVRAWPSMGGKVQISQNGGNEPAWSRDGRELFFRSGGGAEPMLVAAAVSAAGSDLRVTSRTELFSVASYEFATPHRNYDIFPDDRSFVMVRQGRPGQLSEVMYVQNPIALLGRQ